MFPEKKNTYNSSHSPLNRMPIVYQSSKQTFVLGGCLWFLWFEGEFFILWLLLLFLNWQKVTCTWSAIHEGVQWTKLCFCISKAEEFLTYCVLCRQRSLSAMTQEMVRSIPRQDFLRSSAGSQQFCSFYAY